MNSRSAAASQTDSDLLARYARGRDPAAFAELVRRHSAFVFSTARRITRNGHDAEDVTQQCFLELARRAGAIRESLAGWLHRVARSRSLNARRDKSVRKAHESAAAPLNPPNDEPTWQELEPLIDEAIAALPDLLRLPLLLHYLDQKSQVEVATELGIDQSTISRRLHQGVEALRERLKQSGAFLSAATLASRLANPPVHAPPPHLLGSLTKVGLAGIGQVGVSVAAKLVIASTVLIAAAAGYLVVTQISSPPAPLAGKSASPPQAVAAARIGIVVDTLGRPVSNAYISSSLSRLFLGVQSDAHGRFDLSDPRVGNGLAFACSQRSGKLAVFSVPSSTPPTGFPVVLKWDAAGADGNLINSAGLPVQGVPVHIFVTMPDGQRFLALTTGPTDGSGYYFWDEIIPTGPGSKMQASLSLDPATGISTPVINTNGRPQIEFPDMIDPGARAAARPGPKRDRYSGRVTDEKGNPIAGAVISMLYPYLNGVTSAGAARTDQDGRFSRLLPPGAKNVQFSFQHPDFVGTRSQPTAQSLLNGTAVFVMPSGLPVTGTVRDASSKPVPNALVLGGHGYSITGGESEPIEDFTTARTDWHGQFRIGALPTGLTRLEIFADDFAPCVENFDLNEKTPPLNIKLDPGLTWSAQVVVANGVPVAGAKVNCEQWTIDGSYIGPLTRFTSADARGRFTLRELPSEGALMFYAGAHGMLGMNFTWTAGGKNKTQITLYAPILITGAVRDADTDRPVTGFDVLPLVQWPNEQKLGDLDMNGGSHVNSASGRFSQTIDNVGLSEQLPAFAVRIIAKGYDPQDSPKVYPGKHPAPFVIRLHPAAATTRLARP